MKLFIISLMLICLLVSCSKEAEKINPTSNKEFEVEMLFEHAGCKVYRFSDGGRYIYYTDCSGKTSYSESHMDGTQQTGYTTSVEYYEVNTAR